MEPSATSASTSRSLGAHPGDGEPYQNRRDGHEPRKGRHDGRKERGLVNGLDSYTHQDHKGVGEGEGAEYGYPREYQGRGGVGGHAVDLRKSRHLADKSPDGEQVDSRRRADPDGSLPARSEEHTSELQS